MREWHLGLAGFSHPHLQDALYGDLPRTQWLGAYGRTFGAYELACTRLPHFDRPTATRLVQQAPDTLRLLAAAPEALTQPGADTRERLLDWHANVEPILKSPNAGPVHIAWPGVFTPQRLVELESLLELLWARLPWSSRVAVEFHHRSWFRSDAMRVLEEHAAGLVWSTSAGLVPRRVTAPFLYVRLTGNHVAGGEAVALAGSVLGRPDDGRPIHVISTRYHEPYGLAAIRQFATAVGYDLPTRPTGPAGPTPPAPGVTGRSLASLHREQATLDGFVGAGATA